MKRFWCFVVVVGGLCSAGAVGCAGDDDEPSADAGQDRDAGPDDHAVYDPKAVLEVELTLDDADWELIREEGRSVSDVFSACGDPNFEYTKVMATARVGGEKLGKIEVRKKGYLGSLSVVRPSLRLNLQAVQKDLTFRGEKILTLNNSRQDASLTHQCMAYALFARAGVPAPRCSFAHVTVNGEDLGTYVNVEPVRKPFLARHFESDEGLLYEGSGGADFRSDMLDGFEQKTQDSMPTQAPLQAVIDALAKTGDAHIEALEQIIDMDQFMRFWAVESLISHWDGYAGDLNNFFVYERPEDHKLVFIPWGTDGAFSKDHGFLPEVGRPLSVLAWARLPRRLYEVAETRDRYREVLREVLDEIWDEDALLEEVDRIDELTGGAAVEAGLAAQRDFIRTRRTEIEGELDADAPSWIFPERPQNTCVPAQTSKISGTFEATWGDIDSFKANENTTLSLTLGGKAQKLTMLSTSAGIFTDATGIEGPAVRLLAVLPDATFVVVQLILGPRVLEAQTLAFHGFETFGYVIQGKTPQTARPVGLVGDGSVTLEAAGMKTGDVIKGSFSGETINIAGFQ